MIKKLLWWLLAKLEGNHGYSTPIQKRFNVGDVVKINKAFALEATRKFIGGGEIVVEEIGRHDYLIKNDMGERLVDYQFELY